MLLFGSILVGSSDCVPGRWVVMSYLGALGQWLAVKGHVTISMLICYFRYLKLREDVDVCQEREMLVRYNACKVLG